MLEEAASAMADDDVDRRAAPARRFPRNDRVGIAADVVVARVCARGFMSPTMEVIWWLLLLLLWFSRGLRRIVGDVVVVFFVFPASDASFPAPRSAGVSPDPSVREGRTVGVERAVGTAQIVGRYAVEISA